MAKFRPYFSPFLEEVQAFALDFLFYVKEMEEAGKSSVDTDFLHLAFSNCLDPNARGLG